MLMIPHKFFLRRNKGFSPGSVYRNDDLNEFLRGVASTPCFHLVDNGGGATLLGSFYQLFSIDRVRVTLFLSSKKMWGIVSIVNDPVKPNLTLILYG